MVTQAMPAFATRNAITQSTSQPKGLLYESPGRSPGTRQSSATLALKGRAQRRQTIAGYALVCAAISLAGCQSEYDRLQAEQGPAVDAKLEAVNRCLARAAELPEAPQAYEMWLQAQERLKTLRLVSESDQIAPEIVEQSQQMISESEAAVQDLLAKATIEAPAPVHFENGPQCNAAVLLLGADGTANRNEDFRDRNMPEARWYFDGTSPYDMAWTRQRYDIVGRLEFLLVLRQADIVAPEYQGLDEGDHPAYQMGGIECDAFLFSLSDDEPVGAFHFVAPNQRSAGAIGPYEMFLPEEPEQAVNLLRTRLYGAARDFGAAIAAELSPEISFDRRVVRDLLGIRLEAVESAE